jgi:hypothetical protein
MDEKYYHLHQIFAEPQQFIDLESIWLMTAKTERRVEESERSLLLPQAPFFNAICFDEL